MHMSLHTRDWEPVTLTLQALSLVEKAEPVEVRFTLRLRTTGVWECRMNVKSRWILTWHRMDYVSRSLGYFQQLGAHGMLTTVDLLCSRSHVRTRLNKNHWNSIWLSAQSHMISLYTWGFVTILHNSEGVLDGTFFWALTISWSRLLACVWSGPRTTSRCSCVKYLIFYYRETMFFVA